MNTQTTTTTTSKMPENLWITHVNAIGPYLKICGQLNPITDLTERLATNVLPFCKKLDETLSMAQKKQQLKLEQTYLVKSVNRATMSKDIEYLRARIMRLIDTKMPTPQSALFVEVELIDMGYKKIVQCEELLIPQNSDDNLITMPPLSSQYIMLGIFGNFTDGDLENVANLIARQHLMITIENELEGHKFIKMKWKDWNFVEFLISQRKIGSPIHTDDQLDDFKRLLKSIEEELKYEQATTENNNSYKKLNNNYMQNSQNRMVVHNQNQAQQQQRAIYGSGRLGNPNENHVLNLKRELLERERQLQLYLAKERSKLLETQFRQQQQRLYSPPYVPPAQRIQNNMPNLMLTNSRWPITNFYGQIPMLAPTQRLPRPQMSPIVATKPAAAPTPTPNASSHVNEFSNLNGNKPATAAIPPVGTKCYKINKFTVGETYEVIVSFVDNGPCHFSVQLNNLQSRLTKMMNQIERLQLKSLTNEPTVGMACIARYYEDGHKYRAVINSPQPQNGDIKVIYIDYGNAEYVKKSDLYDIPYEFLAEPVFALPFSLAGLKALGPIDNSLKKTFKEMAMYQICKLKVTAPEGPPVVQYCELYLQNTNMLDVLLEVQKSRLVYPKAEHLNNNDAVEIRFIDSPRNFYVQKVANVDEFDKLMNDMDKYYNSKQIVPQHIAVGAAYAVKNDHEWYRAEVIRADEQAIIVRFIDFGYERVVTKNLLSNIAEQHLKMPRQAVHCCLKGFEGNEIGNKSNVTSQFEMLAEESVGARRLFTIRVYRIHPDELHIVNLLTKELNVMKKLYKLSIPFEQYLTLEKEDFNLSVGSLKAGGNNKAKDQQQFGRGTYSINSSNENSSQKGKNSNSIKSVEKSLKQPLKEVLPQKQQQTAEVVKQNQQQQQQQKQVNNFTPAQRLQQLNKTKDKSLNSTTDWDTSSIAGKQQQRIFNNTARQQQQQQQQKQLSPHTRKQQQQDLLNSSFESSDRRSDASTNSNRSRNANTPRQKDRRHNKEAADMTRNQAKQRQTQPQPQAAIKQQNQPTQPKRRSQNAPQGYSQSRRSSMDSQYGAITSSDTQQMSPKSIAAAAAAALNAIKQQQVVYVSLDHNYPIDKIQPPITEEITICWWISPHQFYTHRKSRTPAFEELMRELQKFYHKRPTEQLKLKPGASVIARHRKDRMNYRARIVACNPMLRKYKVLFVDFGNQYTVTSEDIWQVEQRFADFPIMAYCCSFKNIVSNYDHLYIIDRMEKYLPNGAALSCEYKEAVTVNGGVVDQQQLLYYVNIKVNSAFLLDRLKNDKIVTEISPDLRLDLLALQQIRAKIISIKNMLNFKIIFEGCDVPLLCSYDDVRYVKSNPDIGQRFKQFYEGKSCVVNIKSVNDNKVILLRPLLPLFLNDIPNFICSKPRILQTFEARLVFIANASRLYVHDSDAEIQVAKLLDEMYEYYENQGTLLGNYGMDRICAAKSAADSNWYRARIVASTSIDESNNSTIEVYYIDYGNTEILPKLHLKVLEPQFYVERNALAIEINLPIILWTANDKNVKANDLNAAAIEQLRLMLEEQTVVVEALECRRNHLIAEVSLKETKTNLVEELLNKKLIKSRNFDYICKQLEKDKSSWLEYIETVDLTMEDEESSASSDKKKEVKKNSTTQPTQVEVKQTVEPTKQEVIKVVELKALQAEVTEVKPTSPILSEPTAEPVLTEATDNSIVENALTADESNNAEPNLDEPPTSSNAPTPLHFDHSSMEQAVLSHCDNPAQFFIHSTDKIEQLHKLQENLQIVASSLPPLLNVYNGANCISFYTVDKMWYRAEIIDAELMVLKFIDFGNTDCVNDATDIKEMSVFPDIEPFCIPCALPIRPNSTADWVDSANAIFNESYEKNLYFNYITQSSDLRKRPNYIQLFIDGVNIAEKLIEDGYAKPLMMVESGEHCYISHVNSLSDFYIQYEKDSKALELIELCLETSYEKLPQLEEFVKNKIVAALFHDDEKWYRAKLLNRCSDKEAGYEVLFIDYGNAAVTRECREISAEIANLPALSKKCAMDLDLSVYFGWSEEAEAKFAEIAGCGDTTFSVELKAPAADYALVNLHIDALNVNSELEPLCMRRQSAHNVSVDVLNASFGAQSIATIDPNDTTTTHTAVISHINGPDSFYVQFEKDSERLAYLTTTLNASVGMDLLQQQPAEIGKLYAAIFDEDQQLYRVRVLNALADNSYEVCYVDFGNQAFVKQLRILPIDLEHVRPIAKHCALNGYEELDEQAIEAFKQLLNEVDSAALKLEFATAMQANNNNKAMKVNIFTLNDNENILTKIKAAQQEKSIKAEDLLLNATKQECLMAHCVSTQEFYVHLLVTMPKLNEITQQLIKENVLATMPQVAMVPALNQIYAVYAEDDELYYRGLVLSKSTTDNDYYHTVLIDYGNIVSVKEVRELPYKLKAEPAKAIKCALAAATTDASDETLNENFLALIETHFGEAFEIEAVEAQEQIESSDDAIKVKLSINGLDVVSRLMESVQLADSAATSAAVAAPTTPILHDCAVVHINSTISFYTQLVADTSEIESLTEMLLDAETDFPIFNELKVGALCAAKFPDDMNFYRALILQVLDDEQEAVDDSGTVLENTAKLNEKQTTSCLVHFIDFGNNSVASDFRELPAALQTKKRFSQHCSLALKFQNIETATQHFQKYFDEHYSETFQVEFIKHIPQTGGGDDVQAVNADELMISALTPMSCRLFNQSKNVANEIEQMLKAAAEEEE